VLERQERKMVRERKQ